jgi:hypothetical protein
MKKETAKKSILGTILNREEMKKVVGGQMAEDSWCGVNYCYPDKLSCWYHEGRANCYQILNSGGPN